MIDIKKIPFFRFLLPYFLGVLFCLFSGIDHSTIWFVFLIASLVYGLYLIISKSLSKKIQLVFACDIALLSIGVLNTQYSQTKCTTGFPEQLNNADTTFYVVNLNEIPVPKEKTIKLNLNISHVKVNDNYEPANGRIIAYLQRSKSSNTIKIGTSYLIKVKLQEVSKPLNPHAFDYKTYLSNKGIYHAVFIDSNAINETTIPTSFSISEYGLKIKYQLITSLKESGLSNDAYSILAALLTGYDDEIDKNVIDDFSHSGTLHVLSVSGLHVGLIYLVLNFLFHMFDKHKHYKGLNFVFVTVCLWFFALVTGFAAPVLRAVIMFNLLGIGKLFYRNKVDNQINILFVSAFIILLYDPLLLCDIGFQLSYLAMFGILYFYPKWSKWYMPQNVVGKYIWQSMVLSFSATLTTLPLTLFVFHQFPLWFAIANLVIVPLSFILLMLCFLVLIKLKFIVIAVNYITKALLAFISLFDKPGYAFIDQIHFDSIDLLLMCVIIYFVTVALTKKSYFSTVTSLFILVIWQLYSVISSYQAKTLNELVVYQIPKGSTISIKSQQKVILNKIDSSAFNMHVKPNLTFYNNSNLLVKPYNYFSSPSFKLLVIDKKRSIPMQSHLKFTHVLISNNAIPSTDFFDGYRFNTLIADGSNSRYVTKKLKERCIEKGINFYSTAELGAFVMPLKLK